MTKFSYTLFLAILLIAGCEQQRESSQSTAAIDTLYIKEQILTLSDDSFQGRKPFTEGGRKTLEYLESELKALGLEPGNGDSYFQDVPLVELTATPSEFMTISGGTSEIQLKIGDDYVAFTDKVTEDVALDASELVFAGYGVVAPEYGWNDYEGLDVKGKTVVVMVNDPGFESGDSTLFKGETMTYYGRWTYKYEEAARQGAAGVLIIHETVPAGYPWFVVSSSWSGARLNLDGTGNEQLCDVQGWITRDAAIKIFESSGVDLRNYKELAMSPDFEPIPLGVTASVRIQNNIERDASKNVVAKITGTQNPDEVIIYTAHWDHLGVGQPVDGDSIYNGAMDNASGTSTILAIAKAFMQDEKPKRTVVFLFVTAEEQGLLGSAYYANNPLYPVEKTVANLNIDGIETHGMTKDLTIVGIGQSELEELAEKYAKEQGRYIYPDPDAGKGYYYRSDHFNFAKVGIPALYASGAYELIDGGVEEMKRQKELYNQERYHKPADQYNPETWSFGLFYQDGELYYNIGKELANSDQWPKWKVGSEFKAIREN